MALVESMPAAPTQDPAQFRGAMRHLFGGVSVITVGDGDTRTGLTVTSTIPLSTDPPTILVSVNRSSSSWR
jgi:flavin reductase (DIM6/NTAB) family NADH-FMN oxidoreductase RutF